MGEYAMFNDERVKIGTDREMHSLRFEDRFKVRALTHNVDPVKDVHDLYFRLPLPDEDGVKPGDYNGKGYQHLWKMNDKDHSSHYSPDSLEPAGNVQAHTEHGLLLNIKCFHGTKLPEPGGDILKTAWNGRAPHIVLTSIRCLYLKPDNTTLTLMPVITCLACRELWYMTWDELLPYVHGVLKNRLTRYAVWDGSGVGPT